VRVDVHAFRRGSHILLFRLGCHSCAADHCTVSRLSLVRHHDVFSGSAVTIVCVSAASCSTLTVVLHHVLPARLSQLGNRPMPIAPSLQRLARQLDCRGLPQLGCHSCASRRLPQLGCHRCASRRPSSAVTASQCPAFPGSRRLAPAVRSGQRAAGSRCAAPSLAADQART
jgi:hypothetical protein